MAFDIFSPDFILCLRSAAPDKDFELTLPAEQQGQLYKILDLRHRNGYVILKFLRFWQENDPSNQSPSIQNEQILDKKSLPPLVEGLDHGVIWIDLKNKDSAKEIFLNSIKDILQKIKNQMSVAILYRVRSDKELAESIKEIKEEDFLGPYYEDDFNGKEAEVIIYVVASSLYMQSLARARRLLILVTHGDDYWMTENVKAMNLAVEQKLVKKMNCDQDMPSSSSVEEIQSDTSSGLTSERRKKKCLVM
jgi:hypothetical protein